jgi:hypothetical protein
MPSYRQIPINEYTYPVFHDQLESCSQIHRLDHDLAKHMNLLMPFKNLPLRSTPHSERARTLKERIDRFGAMLDIIRDAQLA